MPQSGFVTRVARASVHHARLAFALVVTLLALAGPRVAGAETADHAGDSAATTANAEMSEAQRGTAGGVMALAGIYVGTGYADGLDGFGASGEGRMRGMWRRMVYGGLRVTGYKPLDQSAGGYGAGVTVGVALWSRGPSSEGGTRLVHKRIPGILYGGPRSTLKGQRSQVVSSPSGTVVKISWKALFVTVGASTMVFNGNKKGDNYPTPDASTSSRAGLLYQVAHDANRIAFALSATYDGARGSMGAEAELLARRGHFMISVVASGVHDFGFHTRLALGASL